MGLCHLSWKKKGRGAGYGSIFQACLGCQERAQMGIRSRCRGLIAAKFPLPRMGAETGRVEAMNNEAARCRQTAG